MALRADPPSLGEIKSALSPECFQSSAALSLFFVARAALLSVAVAASLWAVRNYWADHALVVTAATFVYIWFQGLVMWGFFTIGHDCGHGAFSSSSELNWIVGNVVHAIILTPYEPWRLSHRSHHNNTGHLDRDEIFYPNSPMLQRVMTHTMGLVWFMYLITGNVAGRRDSSAFTGKEFAGQRVALGASFASVLVVLLTVNAIAASVGWAAVAVYYGAPLLVFGTFLVVTTFLHHNDEDTPWYADSAWTYVKGSLSSVDRDYGALVNNVSHNIHLHQIHHLFPKIPHYRLRRATDEFRAAFPGLVREKIGWTPVLLYQSLRNWVLYGSAAGPSDVFVYADAKKASARKSQ